MAPHPDPLILLAAAAAIAGCGLVWVVRLVWVCQPDPTEGRQVTAKVVIRPGQVVCILGVVWRVVGMTPDGVRLEVVPYTRATRPVTCTLHPDELTGWIARADAAGGPPATHDLGGEG